MNKKRCAENLAAIGEFERIALVGWSGTHASH